MADLLLEIGTEELPARFVLPALAQLADALGSALGEALGSTPTVTTLGTHRRLTAFVAGLPAAQPAREELVVGPPAGIAFDDAGEPTKAALGFARSQGVEAKDLEVHETERGQYLCTVKQIPGRATAELLVEILPGIISGLSFAKSMYWSTPTFRFARPVRYLLALLEEDVLPIELAGLRAGRATRGHPFLSTGEIELERADLDLYLQRLEVAGVMADHNRRRSELHRQLEAAAASHGGRFIEEELLDEVTFLVELVNVVEGSFPEEYLQLPREVLEAAMKNHQRYFPVHDAGGTLVNRFLLASNRPPEADDAVRRGNERVLIARLFDAKFFWQEDQRTRLEDRLAELEQLVFQEKLGSYREKTERLEALCLAIGRELKDAPADDVLKQVARLAKTDLTTEMVTEFPELQGIMAREYARREGYPDEVCQALGEQYLPRRVDDPVPQSRAGAILALADRLDTLAGCFAAGLVPTGSADPYGLRRAALGALRIAIETNMSLSLTKLIRRAVEPFVERMGLQSLADGVTDALRRLFHDRLSSLLMEMGYDVNLVRAVLQAPKHDVTGELRFFAGKYGVDTASFAAPWEFIGYDDVTDVVQRLDALTKFTEEPGWRDLVKAVERTHNITRGFRGRISPETSWLSPEEQRIGVTWVDENALREPEERKLWELCQETEEQISDLLSQRNYLQAAELFARTFAEPLHVFFEKVFVNVEDEALRNNRLALLKRINLLISESFADLAQVYVE